jgi:hypothetical protein
MARAKKAVASLPWVDQKSFSVNLETQQARFVVPDMKEFNKAELLEAFRKHEFADAAIVAPAGL